MAGSAADANLPAEYASRPSHGLLVAGLSAAFFVVALSVYAVTDHRGVMPVYGDEQHYLVMAKGLVEHRTLEQTEPYLSEFEDREFFDWAYTGTGFEDAQRHVVDGIDGVYNFHQPGLAFLLAVPYWVGGLLGTRLALLALATALVPLTWAATGYVTDERRLRIVGVVTIAFAFPFVMSANQVYPETAGGILTLAFLLRQFERQRSVALADVEDEARPGYSWVDVAAATAVSIAPWFHFRFAFATIAVVLIAVAVERVRGTRRWWLLLVPLALSGLSLVLLNLSQFGRISGPFEHSGVRYGREAAMVFSGLYIDQFQGILFLMPVAVLALVAVGRFVARFGVTAWMVLVAHLAMVVPNAGQKELYGGFGFPGRFGSSGLIVAVPLIAFAVIRFAERRPRLAVPVLGSVLAVQVWQIGRWTFGDVARYNDLHVFATKYPAQFPTLRSVTPILFDDAWAFRYLPNIAGVVFAAMLLGVGVIGSGRGLGRRVAGVVVVGGLAVMAVGVASATPDTVISTPLARAPSEVGRGGPYRSKIAQEGIDEAGNISTGPYTELDPGRYSIALEYVATNEEAEPVGAWSLALQPGAVSTIVTGTLPVTDGLGTIPIVFTVPDDGPRQVDINITWFGAGELRLYRTVIERLDGEPGGG